MYPDGNVYEGEFKDGAAHDYGKMVGIGNEGEYKEGVNTGLTWVRSPELCVECILQGLLGLSGRP